MSSSSQKTILLTGATGFVGQHLFHALRHLGYAVRCATRDVARSERHYPDRDWVKLDFSIPDTIGPAMHGCDAAYYLVHAMRGGKRYAQREEQWAMDFAKAAKEAGISRIVYLGGVAPQGIPSQHLQSRIKTGEILRSEFADTLELRAAMIIGHGSISWYIVRDLAARLPAMLLPRWCHYRSYPVFIDDVVAALLMALSVSGKHPGILELPGPEALSHAQVIHRTSSTLKKNPKMFAVPVLTPRLSSYWIALVTRADLPMAKELVEGLQSDLFPSHATAWDVFAVDHRVSIDHAIEHAIADEERGHIMNEPSKARMLRAVSQYMESRRAVT